MKVVRLSVLHTGRLRIYLYLYLYCDITGCQLLNENNLAEMLMSGSMYFLEDTFPSLQSTTDPSKCVKGLTFFVVVSATTEVA
jgi:hypothetical protein